MFEIGNSLREARLRQNLDFSVVEAGTKIRGKYLQALESERFDVLPGETYVKGFLRTYAEYLGLDGQLYVDEFNSRFASTDEPLSPASPPTYKPRHRVGDSNFVVVALAAIVAVTVLVVVAFGFGNDQPADQSLPTTSQTTSTAGSQTSTQPAKSNKKKKQKARPTTIRMTLTAASGSCWMLIRAGGAQGKQLYAGTLEQGQTLPVSAKRLWLQLGRPDVLKVKIDGHPVGRFPTASGAIVVVNHQGVRQVGTA